ncbi:hypothetical protein ACSLC0_04185 [Stenotrophomonas muris]|uniref:hypothetical protein n=1 Tax=Stenotrophomonas muris TaxID=2963283 RepID=UPI003F85C8A3
MDDETRLAIEELKLQLAATQEVLHQTAGRALALDAVLSATLRSWGKPAAEVQTEVRRVLEQGALEAAHRGAHRPALAQYGHTGDTLLMAVAIAVDGE